MANADLIDEAREVVRRWLGERPVAPGETAPVVPENIAEIVHQFLAVVGASGFALEIIHAGPSNGRAWVGYWTYRGSSFEGFRQPEDSSDPDSARLLACAALLRNDWCRARLPKP
jgi:hypothetical protein